MQPHCLFVFYLGQFQITFEIAAIPLFAVAKNDCPERTICGAQQNHG